MPLQVKAQSKAGDKHSADVNTLIYHNDKLYSGADDGKIIMWDKDLNKLGEVQAHPTTVYCLAAGNNMLYSCSNDGCLLCWELETLKEMGKLLQVEEEVHRLAFSGGKLYSSDDQGNVRCHDGKAVKGVYTLLEPLRELIVYNNCIYTVRNLDLVITEIISEKTYDVKCTFNGRAPMCIAGDNLCFSSRGGKDILVHENLASSQYKYLCEVKDAHEMIINSLVGTSEDNSTFLYSGGWDKQVKLWKIENAACNQVDTCKVEAVINVMASGNKGIIYAGCDDGRVVRLDN